MTQDISSAERVEIVLALPAHCHRVSLAASATMTVADAVAASGLDRVCLAATGQRPTAYGVYGRRLAGDALAAGAGRIELLRPLEIDPKTARRDRVTRARQSRG